MKRQRAQAIIIQNMCVLFGEGMITQNYYGHFFIGGGIEEGETPSQAVLRELQEEANVQGEILFKMDNCEEYYHTFLVDIGEQVPTLGSDPEYEKQIKPENQKVLQKIKLIALSQSNQFTEIDITYFRRLIEECEKRDYYPTWFNQMKNLIQNI